MVSTEATAIDRKAKTVAWKNLATGQTGHLPYDKLILCTGARPKMPPIPGRELTGVTTLASLEDADGLRALAAAGKGKSAVIIGGGLIGMETCEALVTAGMQVTVVEALPQILSFLDPELALLVTNHAKAKGATIITGVGLSEILGKDGKVTAARLADGRELPCELLVMAIGVAPNTALAKDAGLTLGSTGGIATDAHMEPATLGDTSQLAGLLEESVRLAYDLSLGLWPAEHDPKGAGPSLEEFARRVAETSGIPISLTKQLACPHCTNAHIVQLYRIAQEAVTNAIKHAKPSRIDIRLECRAGRRLVLVVRDDGIGRQAVPPSKKGGLGLRIMPKSAGCRPRSTRISCSIP